MQNTNYTYYSHTLSAERLKLCYDLAPARVQRYLEEEIDFVLRSIRDGDRVLELGCGYGRVTTRLATRARAVVGIDLSIESLRLARNKRVTLVQMNAAALAFQPGSFDLVCCVQNGISAFHLDPVALLRGAAAVTRPGGRAQFFSYADAFWDERLAWFRIQAEHGLIGEIDEAQTHDGAIVCRDGFTAGTVTPAQFAELSAGIGASVEIRELDHASVVCDITV